MMQPRTDSNKQALAQGARFLELLNLCERDHQGNALGAITEWCDYISNFYTNTNKKVIFEVENNIRYIRERVGYIIRPLPSEKPVEKVWKDMESEVRQLNDYGEKLAKKRPKYLQSLKGFKALYCRIEMI